MEKLEQIISIYQQIIQKAELELQNTRKRIYYISLLRLILFIGAITGAIVFWSDGWLYISVFAILPFILFIWLVKRHNFWFHQKDFLKKKIVINEQELRAIQYDFSDFENGEEYIDPGHLYTFDLDIFGEHSLFQYINRTSTPVGKQHLADWFNTHLKKRKPLNNARKLSESYQPNWNIGSKSAYSDYYIKESLPILLKLRNGPTTRVTTGNMLYYVLSRQW